MYVQDISTKICDGNAIPTIEKEKFSTALVNGQNSLGPVVGNFCMNLAIEKAKKHGVGWVTANSMFIFLVFLLLTYFKHLKFLLIRRF
jgi:LDH2 family malate/lactate/ureidoglycolate dehydrogenase